MNEILDPQPLPNPSPSNPLLGMPSNVNAGAVTIEVARAVAETKGKLQVAKAFPRDINAAHRELMDACKLPSLAAKAFYSVPRAGGKVTGPSVRLAEEIARCWGNIDYGHRELSRSDGKSEVEVYAWDMQTNLYSRRQITVLHVMDTKDGPRKLRDQKDIDDKISNVASKQLRGRILAVLPKWLVADAEDSCRRTLAGSSDEPISARVRKMLDAFAPMGVTQAMIEDYLEHPLANATADDITTLTGVYNALSEGAKVAEYFDLEAGSKPAPAGVNALLTNAPSPTIQHQPAAQAAPAAPVTRRTRTAAAAPKPEAPAAPPQEQEQIPPEDDPSTGAEYSPPPAAEGGAGRFF